MAQPATHMPIAIRMQDSARLYWHSLCALTLLALISTFGNGWDLYWHIQIGRDTFWIPPHTMMYTAVAISGLWALAVVLYTTWRLPAQAAHLSAMVGFRAPLGFFIIGIGVLQMVISAPFDDWWHRLYGVDVSVWSPPHLVGLSGAITMLSGMIIAAVSERQRVLPLARQQERVWFLLIALLVALVMRWTIFLNSTTILLSWSLLFDRYAIARPWVPWWGLWAGLCTAWVFVASTRMLPGRARWTLPLTVLLFTLALRGLEFGVSALGFYLTLPWDNQTLNEPFLPFGEFYDRGMWITTFTLIVPALVIAGLARMRATWQPLPFGLICGILVGVLLTAQFLLLRPIFSSIRLSSEVIVQTLLITCATAFIGGVIGAYQGDWLAHFRR